MQVVHFLADAEPGPLCRRADSPGWLWSASPHRVTCPRCALLLANVGSRDRPAPLVAPADAQHGTLTALVRAFASLGAGARRVRRRGRTGR